MQAESFKPESTPTGAVFLSYASQDAEAARRICDALRAVGIEVWFDQSELRGGDVWDSKIRQQIHDCRLFIPIISAHTDARTEGYFRLEWKLAVDRSHLMADDAAFLFPVVIDETPDATARVPERFRTVQWTRLASGEAPPAFGKRVTALLAGAARAIPAAAGAHSRAAIAPRRSPARSLAYAAVTLVLVAAIAVLAWRSATRSSVNGSASQRAAASATNAPPEHSIAVLPFADLSEGRNQEYFSDGLAEELLNLLSKVPGLQVAARTSAFSFKGNAADIPTIGRQLMVARVLEGSVSKVGGHLRVTAQLVRTDNGYEVWSGTYDREIGDVFHLQDEIAAAVVKALKLTLLGGAPRSTSTQNPGAYLVFLQGRAKMASQRMADIKEASDDFARVLKLDPSYGPAYVELAGAKLQLAEFEVTSERSTAFVSAVEEAKVLLERAFELDPTNAQAYIERGNLRLFSDRKGAEKDYRRGIELNPNSARGYGALASLLYEDPERRDEVLPMLDRARQLDPLEPKYDVLKAVFLYLSRGELREPDALLVDVVARHPLYQPAVLRLAEVRFSAGNFAEAAMYAEQALKLDPLSEMARWVLIMAYMEGGDLGAAEQVSKSSRLPLQHLPLYLHAGDWHHAAALAYAALADDTLMPVAEPWAYFAMRMEAHRTGDFRRARAELERQSGVTWNADGVPRLPNQLGLASASAALGDMLIASGEREKGERLLRASLADINYVEHALKRGELWYLPDQALAFALVGDRKASLAALGKAARAGTVALLWPIESDPAYDPMRDDPEFQAVVRTITQNRALQRQRLDRLRASGQLQEPGRTAISGKSEAN